MIDYKSQVFDVMWDLVSNNFKVVLLPSLPSTVQWFSLKRPLCLWLIGLEVIEHPITATLASVTPWPSISLMTLRIGLWMRQSGILNTTNWGRRSCLCWTDLVHVVIWSAEIWAILWPRHHTIIEYFKQRCSSTLTQLSASAGSITLIYIYHIKCL